MTVGGGWLVGWLLRGGSSRCRRWRRASRSCTSCAHLAGTRPRSCSPPSTATRNSAAAPRPACNAVLPQSCVCVLQDDEQQHALLFFLSRKRKGTQKGQSECIAHRRRRRLLRCLVVVWRCGPRSQGGRELLLFQDGGGEVVRELLLEQELHQTLGLHHTPPMSACGGACVVCVSCVCRVSCRVCRVVREGAWVLHEPG